MVWIYQNKEFTSDDIKDNIGFVYNIHNLVDDKNYIGKKLFTKAKTRFVKRKKKKSRVESDWQDYYGSNEDLKADVVKHGKDKFFRTILYLCKSKGECTYFETKEILINDAILKENYYNQWLSCKVSRSHLSKLILDNSGNSAILIV
jgi:hypothetical protein